MRVLAAYGLGTGISDNRNDKHKTKYIAWHDRVLNIVLGIVFGSAFFRPLRAGASGGAPASSFGRSAGISWGG